MLLLLLTFLNLFDYSSVGVLSLLFWGVAWWWYHCRTRHQWSWWPNPGPSCKYKIISISLTHWRSPRPSWRCPAPCRGSRPTGGGTLPRLSRCAPAPTQYSTVQYSTVQYSTAPGPARIWWWRTAPWSHSQLQTVAGMFAKSRWHLQSSYCICYLRSSRRHETRCWQGSRWAASPVPQQISS